MRIWPSYFVAITLCFVLTRFIELPNRTVTTVDYLLNIPFINGYIGTDYVDGAHWYLTTLVSGIVIYSIILKFKDKTQCCLLMLWLFLIAVLCVLTAKFIGFPKEAFKFVYQLLGGEYIPFLVLGNLLRLIDSKSNVFYTILLGILIIADLYLTMGFFAFVVALFALFITSYALHRKGILLKFKPLVFIGTISYSIYLIHQNIGFIILNNMIAIVGQYYIWMSVLVSLISVTFGFIFYYLVEKPIGILLTRRKQSE